MATDEIENLKDVKRMRYSNGLFLKEEEFNLEQNYHIRMRRLHNRNLHSYGIVKGLEVSYADNAVKITSGMALAKVNGKMYEEGIADEGTSWEIVLTKDFDYPLDITTLPVYIYIYPKTEAMDLVQEIGGDKEIHWLEGVGISHSSRISISEDNGNIILAKIVNTDGTIKVKYTENDGTPLRIYSGACGKLALSVDGKESTLSIEGKKFDTENGIQVNSPITEFTGKLAIDGNCTIDGNLIVKGARKDGVVISDNIITVHDYPPPDNKKPLIGDGGLEVYRGGTAPNAQIIWREEAIESNSKWKIGLENNLVDLVYGPDVLKLTDTSIADELHKHSKLVGADGSPDPALSVDNNGNVSIGGDLNVTGMVSGTLAINIVDTNQIEDNAVTSNKLQSNTSDDTKRAVTTDHIKNNAVTSDKLRSDASIDASRAVTTDHIKDNAVTEAKLEQAIKDKLAAVLSPELVQEIIDARGIKANLGNRLDESLTKGGQLRSKVVGMDQLDAITKGKLVTNGDSHDHSGGDGANIMHSSLIKDDGINPHVTTAANIDNTGGVNQIVTQINAGMGVINKKNIDPASGARGWVRLPFLPKKYSNAPEFEHFIIHSNSGSTGAKGNMEIPVPPGATKIKKFRISGNVNSNGITFSLYQSGWNNATNNYINNIILSGIAINGAPFNELFTIDRSIDPETHTIALYVVANGSSDIFLVAAEFE